MTYTENHIDILGLFRDCDEKRSNAAYGVLYALVTCRVAPAVELTFRKLGRSEIEAVLDSLLVEGVTMGDTARWLNAKYA